MLFSSLNIMHALIRNKLTESSLKDSPTEIYKYINTSHTDRPTDIHTFIYTIF